MKQPIPLPIRQMQTEEQMISLRAQIKEMLPKLERAGEALRLQRHPLAEIAESLFKHAEDWATDPMWEDFEESLEQRRAS